MLCLEWYKELFKELDMVFLDEENEDGDFMVYECLGLVLIGEMEVCNFLFDYVVLFVFLLVFSLLFVLL